MFDPEDPPCVGRFGYGSGWHLPELSEDQRIGVAETGYCSRCPVNEDCFLLSVALRGVDLASETESRVFAMYVDNVTAGQRARNERAGVRA